jgi:DNA replication protein DnaC
MELRVIGNLTKGKILRKPVTLSMENVSNNGIYGGLVCETYPIPCYRCSGKKFHLWRDGDDYICFCANDACLKEDSEASKEIDRIERAKRLERNEHGQIMTGAEKFRLGLSYKNACLAKWIAPKAYQSITNLWLTDRKSFLIVMGNPGTGKTFLSASVLNYLFEKKEEVFYTTHRRFIEEIHRAIEEGKTQHSVIDKMAYKKFLIIDDLASATCTEWQVEMLLELIDRRYSDKLKTLITTNLDKNGLKETLGGRTYSRLFDYNNQFLEFWTEDNRLNEEIL